MLTVAAGAVGLLAGGGPVIVRAVQPDTRSRKLRARPTAVHRHPDPGYAKGPIQALQRPVHGLKDLTPPAPPTAVALTIDDGPHPTWTPKMLDLLAEFKVPATFSLIGEQVIEFPQLVKRIVASGHQISDHTMTHPLDLPGMGSSKIKQEIGEAHDRIAQATGVAPKFFRSPGGAWSNQVLDTAAEHGMINIDWAVDPRDWARPGTGHISETLLAAKPGDILLCHDGGGDRSETIAALRTVIPTLQKRGLTFVAL
ncbi:polysaccharide deacetylase family protein [Actinoallomurus sp. NBC_01490]|jgi:peptidoglycan/xylan/chitin deacetylase (PgdA/CDA1 family)|uniref:polysaccharide deacetylase family protein n=1 Tax=Actinoallomurus sp. NBC_01490 TaxID=2903557 RepID=UPI002E332222|nr:polysaccharide deacetylase family protein [Actinoallomurus sp. NBC_01490]